MRGRTWGPPSDCARPSGEAGSSSSAWEPAKPAARLQAATSSGRPVLLRVDFEGGHGIGSTSSQAEAETADLNAFLLWQLGVDGFQPPAP